MMMMMMNMNFNGTTKVVRFSGSNETQTIQQDDKGNPPYSSRHGEQNLSENRNFDICVADSLAGAIVVVSADGELRFRYIGPPSTPRKLFDSRLKSITTDSQGNVLTSERYNHRIHIIDRDGLFLRFIHNSDLHGTWGLCVDSGTISLRLSRRHVK